MNNQLTVEDIVHLLKELCGYSQKTVASNLGISPQYLSDILRYKREPGNKVLKAIGLKKKVTYEKV